MRIEQQPAYVLHARAYRETSLLLECLTRDHGRLGVVARGVRGERARIKRAQLEPFQPLAMDLLLRGELATLTGLDSGGLPVRLGGDIALSGLYLNELVVRLTGRQDPSPALFEIYATALSRLGQAQSPAWTLRRFERDLLEAIGYGLSLQFEAETGEALLPQATYRYEVEQGALHALPMATETIRGDDLLALEQDRMPDRQGLRDLRNMMRRIIRFHLGGGELRSWRVLSQAISRH